MLEAPSLALETHPVLSSVPSTREVPYRMTFEEGAFTTYPLQCHAGSIFSSTCDTLCLGFCAEHKGSSLQNDIRGGYVCSLPLTVMLEAPSLALATHSVLSHAPSTREGSYMTFEEGTFAASLPLTVMLEAPSLTLATHSVSSHAPSTREGSYSMTFEEGTFAASLLLSCWKHLP